MEQQIIDELIWKSGSPIWEAIRKTGDAFPKFEQTALPGNMVFTEEQQAVTSSVKRPSVGECANAAKIEVMLTLFVTEQSPGPSAIDRFQSPIANQIKKQLFGVKPAQAVLQNSVGLHLGGEKLRKVNGSLAIILRKVS